MAKYLILKKRKYFLKAAQDITMTSSNVIIQAAFCDDNKKINLPRIGFTATKRLGKAYYRNLTKRRLRAVCREIGQKKLCDDVDYVLVGRRNTAVCEYKQLKDEVFFCLNKINNIIKKRRQEKSEK